MTHPRRDFESAATKAANETHADCLLMIVRAEIRMADEIDKGQELGEISTGGRRAKPSEVLAVTDLGVRDREQLREWRETRDAGMNVVESAIDAARTPQAMRRLLTGETGQKWPEYGRLTCQYKGV